MDLIERVAAAMYNAPDPCSCAACDDPDATVCVWPPSHPIDLAWWLSRAKAAINAIKESDDGMSGMWGQDQ